VFQRESVPASSFGKDVVDFVKHVQRATDRGCKSRYRSAALEITLVRGNFATSKPGALAARHPKCFPDGRNAIAHSLLPPCVAIDVGLSDLSLHVADLASGVVMPCDATDMNLPRLHNIPEPDGLEFNRHTV
jgi:hypothetical protein